MHLLLLIKKCFCIDKILVLKHFTCYLINTNNVNYSDILHKHTKIYCNMLGLITILSGACNLTLKRIPLKALQTKNIKIK